VEAQEQVTVAMVATAAMVLGLVVAEDCSVHQALFFPAVYGAHVLDGDDAVELAYIFPK